MEQKSDLKTVFNGFAKGIEMDGKTFAKVAKDCHLLDKKLTTTDVDLIFAKVKTSSSVRTITFEQFQNGLKQFAEKKGISFDDICKQVETAGGPQFVGTQGASRFHDDKSTYTGTHVGKDSKPQPQHGAQLGEEEKAPVQKKHVDEVVAHGQPASSLDEVFNSFTAGALDMDGKTFAKFAKDCKILDKKLTPTDIDLIFAKIVTKGARKITFDQFQNGVKQCADKKGVSQDSLTQTILQHGGPTFSGTKADKVKFHDDKNLYTGVYANGGPTNVDKDKITSISQTCDRSAADVRGVKK